MSYTAIAAAKYTAPQDNARSLHIKSLKPSNALKDKKSPLPSGISADVWEKYKSLAAGNAADKIEKETKMAAATPAPQAQPAEKTQTTPAQNTGIAAILNAYQQNKKQRSQMRTLTITKPQ